MKLKVGCNNPRVSNADMNEANIKQSINNCTRKMGFLLAHNNPTYLLPYRLMPPLDEQNVCMHDK